VPSSAYLVIVEADDAPIADPYSWSGWVSPTARDPAGHAPCAPAATSIEAEVTKRQPLRQGFLLQGTVTLVEGSPVRADGLVVTAVLQDKQTEVLDVLAGTPTVRARDVPTGVIQVGHRLEFRLLSDMPLGKDVASVDVMVEVLPDAVVALPPRP
jgi:hypothetical protein